MVNEDDAQTDGASIADDDIEVGQRTLTDQGRVGGFAGVVAVSSLPLVFSPASGVGDGDAVGVGVMGGASTFATGGGAGSSIVAPTEVTRLVPGVLADVLLRSGVSVFSDAPSGEGSNPPANDTR